MDLDKVAQYEPPYQALSCLQIQLFLSLVLKELTLIGTCSFLQPETRLCWFHYEPLHLNLHCLPTNL